MTGSYTFWIASDDKSELWLSTNDNPVNKVNRASVPDWTDPREWTKFPSQKSAAPISLTAGQRYYVEALQKEGDGGDNLAVGWSKPGQATTGPSEVIPGSVLSPFSGSPAGPTLTTLSPSSAAAGGPDFTLTVNGSNFASGSVVRWNGAPRNTTFVSATRLTAAIPAADIAAAGSASVTVQNPGGAGSNTLTFTIASSPGGGTISREVWTGISGTFVANIPVGTPPNTTDTLPSFEAPTNWADNYGTRLRGYITAPVTGSYTFWIASDDKSELWLSTNDNPVNKVKIASVPDWTEPHEWDKFPSQKSAAISLTAGQLYYVEALQKEGDGGDNLSVGWAKPGQATSAPSEVIPGSVLSPFSGSPAGPTLTTLSPSSATAGGPDLTLTVDGSNFASGSVVRWNGAPRNTTFVSATRLTAAIPAADIAAAGSASVTVQNPRPERGPTL